VVVTDETQDDVQVATGEELSGRITLRLPESLKIAIETAAAEEGISTNAWLVRTLARTTSPKSFKRGKNRLQGYAQG
jgi:predicted HicB family RNase H-like nuclease